MKPNPIAILIDTGRSIRLLLRTGLEPNHYSVYDAADGRVEMKEGVARRLDVVIPDLCLDED
jgi:DNA-binding response OmpR family regulator